jgi:hypothetical protein
LVSGPLPSSISPRGNPADHDGSTDHIGGTLLAFRASRHRLSIRTGEASVHKKRCFRSTFERPVLASFQSLAQHQLEPPLVSGSPRRDTALYTQQCRLSVPRAPPCFALSMAQKPERRDRPSNSNTFKLRHSRNSVLALSIQPIVNGPF